MKVEVRSAAHFLTNLLRVKSDPGSFRNNVKQLELFCAKLEDMLCLHYQKHWFPEKPFKGSGYRCIRINHKMDPIISKAGSESGFDEARLRQLFPDELTMWIDPREVSYRIGENGSICVLFDGAVSPKCQVLPPGSPSKTSTPRTVTITLSANENSRPHHYEASTPHHFDRHITTCKESVRNNSSWDSSFIMDPRNMNIEQYTYVSS